MYKAVNITVKGRVQGVGFRPFVYSLSQKYNLKGTVQNNSDCVIIHVEGNDAQLDYMVNELKEYPPKLAKVKELIVNNVALVNYIDFTIVQSKESVQSIPWMPTDAAICEECLQEMNDSQNRRFRYPFINCTQCGPRYTIINGLPYDRPKTTMREFEMCEDCREEYENPLNRRHHAQPICCSKCGPTIFLKDKKGVTLAKDDTAIFRSSELITQGDIVAIKGIGGFHLACDAYQENVVERLRLKKKRPQRPLAVMVKSLEIVKKLCHISKREEELLTSPEMPIVVLQRKSECLLPENISPGLSTIGIMLPYTPLHHLLFHSTRVECIVMTSANPSGLPIQYREDQYLQEISDYVVTHNRDIDFPIDDSVVQYDEEKLLFLRRARGYAPDPMKVYADVDEIIALGGNQKSTFAVGKQNHIVVSPHIGDLENEEMLHSFEEQLHHYKKWLGVNEKYIAIDRHPLYATTQMAKGNNSKVIPVQHHHAHHVSCMTDNHLEEPCLGIILDGTGYGEDGHIWGFEFLYGDAASYERLAHLQYTPLPGGEKTVKEPWRYAVGLLLYYWPNEGEKIANRLFPEKSREISIIKQMIINEINTPMGGTCGRLFDAVSAILGVCLKSTYEGEAAIKLSDYMNTTKVQSTDETYPYELKMNSSNLLQVDFSPMIYQIVQSRLNLTPIHNIIQTFHHTIITCCVDVAMNLVRNRPELRRTVVLSGGSFQNLYLTRELSKRLENVGFDVYTHKNVPCHDGGLSLGQVMIAAEAIKKNT